jgi:hypothetical protein
VGQILYLVLIRRKSENPSSNSSVVRDGREFVRILFASEQRSREAPLQN